MAGTIKISVELDTKQADRELQGFKGRFQSAINDSNNSVKALQSSLGALRTAFAALGGLAIVSTLKQFADASINAAIAIDKQTNALKALTGSAVAAQRRFKELFDIAQRSPGLTTALATTLDAQLRVFNVAEQTINRLLPVIGRLNAINPLGDPRQFVNNLTQLISQNFERQDLKELVGQSTIAGQLIKQIFNVDNPTNAEAIRTAAKRMGITTVEALASALIEAGESNSALKNATETLGGQFEKLQERIQIAIAPIGEEILKTILPAFKELVEVIERDAPKIAQLFRDNRDELLSLANAFVTAASAVGQLVGELGNLDRQFGIVQNLTPLALSLFPGGPANGLLLRGALGDAARQRAATTISTGETPAEFEARLQDDAAAMLRRLEGGGGGGTGGRVGGGVTSAASSAARAAARKKAQEIKDLQEKILKEDVANFADTILKSLEDIERAVTGQNLEGVRAEAATAAARADRPRQLAASNIANAERIRQIELESAQLEANTAKAAQEKLEKLPKILSDSERFMRGFADATVTVGDAFERFGQNVAHAFTNVRDVFNGLKQAVLGFFNDLIGNTLQNLVRGTLGGLLGGSGGGGIFGSLGNLFRTAPTFPASISGGGGVGAIASSFFGGGGAGSSSGNFTLDPLTAKEFGLGKGGFSLPSSQSIGATIALLGVQLGVGLGGKSTAGKILGGIGGALGVIGLPLLIGASLLGKAAQRKSDEEASGEMLRAALDGIEQIMSQVSSGAIDGAQARSLFENQVLAQFIQQIKTLKTKSVVDSRLKNQVADLRNVFESRLPGAVVQARDRVANQQRIAGIDQRLVPEFATGGTTEGGLAFLHAGEKVVNLQQQAAMRAMAGADIFERAGVPGIRQNAVFDAGGTMGRGLDMPIEITLDAQISIGKSDATAIHIMGANTASGRQVTVKNVKDARLNREL